MEYKLQLNSLLYLSVLEHFIKSFNEDVLNNCNDLIKNIAIIFKVEFTDTTVRSISNVF
jgi:hypothetical protein